MRLVTAIIIFSLMAALALAYTAGFFDRVRMDHAAVGPLHIVYRSHAGPYQRLQYEIGDVARYLESAGVRAARGFAILDANPQHTPASGLGGMAGCITDSLLPAPPAPYRSSTLAAADAVRARMPMRSAFSPMTAAMRLRPRIRSYLNSHGLLPVGPVMEIYDRKNRVIDYVQPVSRP